MVLAARDGLATTVKHCIGRVAKRCERAASSVSALSSRLLAPLSMSSLAVLPSAICELLRSASARSCARLDPWAAATIGVEDGWVSCCRRRW